MKMRKTRKVAGKSGAVAKKVRTVKEEAEEYVAKFDAACVELSDMQGSFEQDYPEAALALESIKVQEDAVEKAMSDAKAKVAAAGETVGDFKCTLAFSQAGYDDKVLYKVITRLDPEKQGLLLRALLDAEVIKGIKVDKQNSGTFAATNPKLASPLKEAWREKTPLTPRVSVPKR